jgi:hypothetical protein
MGGSASFFLGEFSHFFGPENMTLTHTQDFCEKNDSSIRFLKYIYLPGFYSRLQAGSEK